jgi:hypothetical protein
MKTRQGFVSNSSTTSFVIYGVVVKRDNGLFCKDAKDPIMYQNALQEAAEQLDMEYWDDEDDIYIGRSWAGIGGNETGDQLRDSVYAALKKLGITETPETFEGTVCS